MTGIKKKSEVLNPVPFIPNNPILKSTPPTCPSLLEGGFGVNEK